MASAAEIETKVIEINKDQEYRLSPAAILWNGHFRPLLSFVKGNDDAN